MPTITTQGQANTRAAGPDPVESPSPERKEPIEWTQNEDGTFSGGGCKHYGDKQPKVRVSSVQEAEELLRTVDSSAKISKGVAKSQQDTVDTCICELAAGDVIISGPLATKVAALRGLMLLTEGEGNPRVENPEQKAQVEQTEWLPPAVNPGIAAVNAATKEAASQPPPPEVTAPTAEGFKGQPPPGEPIAGKLQPEKAIAAEEKAASSSSSSSDSDSDPLATKVENKSDKSKSEDKSEKKK